MGWFGMGWFGMGWFGLGQVELSWIRAQCREWGFGIGRREIRLWDRGAAVSKYDHRDTIGETHCTCCTEEGRGVQKCFVLVWRFWGRVGTFLEISLLSELTPYLILLHFAKTVEQDSKRCKNKRIQRGILLEIAMQKTKLDVFVLVWIFSSL